MLSRKAGLTGFFLLCMAPSPSLAETAHQLQQALNAQPSATRVLQQYCQGRFPGLALQAVALPTGPDARPPSEPERFALRKGETLRTRHVSLRCGALVLSDAWNWYVPERLTAEMNKALDNSTEPFGHVVASLHFTRLTLSSETGNLPPGVLLRNRALLLRGGDRLPFSLVEESYLAAGFNHVALPPE